MFHSLLTSLVAISLLACGGRRADPSTGSNERARPTDNDPSTNANERSPSTDDLPMILPTAQIGPLPREPLFGPYDSRSAYCKDKAKCCCEPAISALKAPLAPTGPWKSVDLLRGQNGRTGPWHLLVQTEHGWFGEFFAFAKFEGDEMIAIDPTVEIRDWLGLGSPQIILRITYSISSSDSGVQRKLSRETLAIVGVGSSRIPTYLVTTTVHLDEENGVRTADSWSVTINSDGKGRLLIDKQVGKPPERIVLGAVPITFP
jgi:hypothetical protein